MKKQANKENATPVKKKILHDIVPKILCVLAACILWLYVSQVDSDSYEETFNGVEVELVNTSVIENKSGLYVYNGYGNTVNVTVYGKKSILNRYDSEDIRVYADLRDINVSGKHTVPILVDTPAGISLGSLSENNVNVYVDEKTTVELDVKAKVTGAFIASGCRLDEAVPEYGTVKATGPNEILKDADFARVSLELGDISSSMSVIGKIDLVSKNGEMIDLRYVKLDRNEVKVNVPVYTTKEVTLGVDYKYGYFNDGNVNITVVPKTITVKGDPADLEGFDKLSVGTLDEKKFASDDTQSFKINLPDGITSMDDAEVAQVSVVHKGTTIRAYTVESPVIVGDDDVECSLVSPYVTVRLRGTEEELKNTRASDITVKVDVSEYDSGIKGVVTVLAEVIIEGKPGVYAIGDYPVQVKIG